MERGTMRAWAVAAVLGVDLLMGCAAVPDRTVVPTTPVPLQRRSASWKALRDRNVEIQAWDYSCGPAAVATIMRYYYGDPVTEEKICRTLWPLLTESERLDRETGGFTIGDLEKAAHLLGYPNSQSTQTTLSVLLHLRAPVVVHLVCEENKHFAVYRGVREDRVYLADPSRGNIRVPLEQFAREWSGVVLTIEREPSVFLEDFPLLVRDEAPIRPELEPVRRSLYRLR